MRELVLAPGELLALTGTFSDPVRAFRRMSIARARKLCAAPELAELALGERGGLWAWQIATSRFLQPRMGVVTHDKGLVGNLVEPRVRWLRHYLAVLRRRPV